MTGNEHGVYFWRVGGGDKKKDLMLDHGGDWTCLQKY